MVKDRVEQNFACDSYWVVIIIGFFLLAKHSTLNRHAGSGCQAESKYVVTSGGRGRTRSQ